MADTRGPRLASHEQPIVLIDELARLLDTSVRTIYRQLRAGTFFIPELPRVDKTHRWSRARVYAAIETETRASHADRLKARHK